MVGALALLVAGFGSVAVNSHPNPATLAHSGYQSISDYTGSDAGADGVDVTRDFDRKAFARQTSIQALQLQKALAEQTSLVQKSESKLKTNQWMLPVVGYHLTARFGQRSSLWSTVHTGLDFAGPSGTKIVSVGTGVVKSADYEGAYGNRTVVTMLDGTDVWYCHQSRIVVRPGDRVTPGQVVGYTGSTGNVTGPHLHLEIHPGGGAAVDPYRVLVAHGVTP